MTPAETYLAIEAGMFKEEQKQKDLAWVVWHGEAFRRIKKLPPFEKMFKSSESQELDEEEKNKRHAEFMELKDKYGR